MSLVMSETFGPKLCKILGLEVRRIQSIQINVQPGDVVTLDVRMMLLQEDQMPVLDLVSNYELARKGD